MIPETAPQLASARLPDATFRLDENFIDKYKRLDPPFGFPVFSDLVYRRTYSRIQENGENEVWWETIRRVVEGCYRMQERHIRANDLGWSESRAQRSAREMFQRMWSMKFLPPGRGLWAVGSPITEERGLYAACNNCAFVSTENIEKDLTKPFLFLMDMSMLGVGVGFDLRGANKITIKRPSPTHPPFYMVPDSREGWVSATGQILEAFFCGSPVPRLDYRRIRGPGLPIKCFGGVTSGPDPLIKLHQDLIALLLAHSGKPLTGRLIADIMNMIGVCVVSGNVRRTAEIMFGDPQDEEYLNLKNYRWNKEIKQYVGPMEERSAYGWTSNNSVFAAVGMDYHECAERTRINGEPGYFWLKNAQWYGRMCEPPNYRDRRATGGNPCLEQTLENYELCCLVENFIDRHETLDDFLRTLKYSYLYAKTITLGKTHWPETNKVLLRNRRIGSSLAGVSGFADTRGLDTLREWCEAGYQAIEKYDRSYSEWFCVPESIKKTSVKPGGTVPTLPAEEPGMHWFEDRCFLRRMRIAKDSDLIPPLIAAGYRVEPCVGSEETTVVVAIPIKVDVKRTAQEVSLWEQMGLAAFLQRYWADNQVSCTVTFDPEREGAQIEHALDHFQYHLKGISFLPRLAEDAYPQMPYERITEEEYAQQIARVQPVNFGKIRNETVETEKFCDGASCQIK